MMEANQSQEEVIKQAEKDADTANSRHGPGMKLLRARNIVVHGETSAPRAEMDHPPRQNGRNKEC